MPTIRLPLVETLESRDGSLAEDTLLTNCFIDPDQTRKYVTKRFGTSSIASLDAGEAQGMFSLLGQNYAIQNDVLINILSASAFTYTPPNPALLLYHSLNTPNNSSSNANSTIFKTAGAAYIFNGSTVTQIPPNGGVSSLSFTNYGSAGTPGVDYDIIFNPVGSGADAAGKFTVGGGVAGTGVVFTNRMLPTTGSPDVAAWSAVAFSPTLGTAAPNGFGLYVAIASGSRDVMTSVDGGVTWVKTATALPAAVAWGAIAWNGSVFLATAYGTTQSATSTNGTTWTSRSCPLSAAYSIQYGIGMSLLAFGSKFFIGSYGKFAYSGVSTDNGVTWASTGSVVGPCFEWNSSSNYLLCIYGLSCDISYDGITWTRTSNTLPSVAVGYISMAYSPTAAVFCAISTGNSNVAATSPDGISWSPQTLPYTTNWKSIKWNGVVFCAISSLGGIEATSPDGATWTAGGVSGLSSNPWGGMTSSYTQGTISATLQTSTTVLYTGSVPLFNDMGVTDASGGIPAGTTIVGVVTGVSFTLSNAATVSDTRTLNIAGAFCAVSSTASPNASQVAIGLMAGASGSVTSSRITNPGTGYQDVAPTPTFTNDAALSGVVATANISAYPGTTVPGIAYLDGVYYVLEAGTNRIYGSGNNFGSLEDPTQWTALNYISANSVSGNAVAIARHLNYIVAFKENSIEYFYDAGNPPPGSPLLSVPQAVTRIGCASAGSICSVGDEIFFMSRCATKGIQVSVIAGQGTQAISTPSVDRVLNYPGATDTDVYSFYIKIQGHSFYVLSLKNINVTLALDLTTKSWARWTFSVPSAALPVTSIILANGLATVVCAGHGFADGDLAVIAGANQSQYNVTANISYINVNSFAYPVSGNPVTPATGTITAQGWTEGFFPMNNYLNGGAQDLFQHETNGKIYQALPSLYQDDGSPINTKVRSPIFDGGNSDRKRISAAEIIGNKVVSTANIRYSDDDYATSSQYRKIDLNAQRARVIRLGSTRARSFEIRHTDNTAFRIESLQLDVDSSEG